MVWPGQDLIGKAAVVQLVGRMLVDGWRVGRSLRHCLLGNGVSPGGLSVSSVISMISRLSENLRIWLDQPFCTLATWVVGGLEFC